MTNQHDSPRKKKERTEHPMWPTWHTWEIAVSAVLCTLSVSFSVGFTGWLMWKMWKTRLRSQEPDFNMVNTRVVNHPPADIESGTQNTGATFPACQI